MEKMNQVQRMVDRELLKHAAGTAMFCPLCQDLLDWRTTAIISLGPSSRTCCSGCLDKIKSELGAKISNPAINILDGRTA